MKTKYFGLLTIVLQDADREHSGDVSVPMKDNLSVGELLLMPGNRVGLVISDVQEIIVRDRNFTHPIYANYISTGFGEKTLVYEAESCKYYRIQLCFDGELMLPKAISWELVRKLFSHGLTLKSDYNVLSFTFNSETTEVTNLLIFDNVKFFK